MQTSWLFTSVAKYLNLGLLVRAGLGPETAELQVQRTDYLATLPPFIRWQYIIK